MQNTVIAQCWIPRAFKALDSVKRGFLFKHEVLQPIFDHGMEKHGLLVDMIVQF
jgi:glutaminase